MAAAATVAPLSAASRQRAASLLYSNVDDDAAAAPVQPRAKKRISEIQTSARPASGRKRRSENDDGGKLARKTGAETPFKSRSGPSSRGGGTSAAPAHSKVGADSTRFGRPLKPVNHAESYNRISRWSASSYRGYARQLRELARPKEETYVDPRHQIKGLNGDARFARIKECLLGFQNKPIELQMIMHATAFQVEGPLIWGEEYFSNTKMILDREGWKAKISILFILTQRKMGKTYFLGQHAVIHALNPSIVDFRIACISKTLDQAILTVAISRKLFGTHDLREEYTLTVNQVKRIEITKDGMSAEIRAYSGNPDAGY